MSRTARSGRSCSIRESASGRPPSPATTSMPGARPAPHGSLSSRRVIVRKQDLHDDTSASKGTLARISVPCPGAESISRRPPSASTARAFRAGPGAGRRPHRCSASETSKRAIVAHAQQQPVRIGAHGDRDPARGGVLQGVVDRLLYDPERGDRGLGAQRLGAGVGLDADRDTRAYGLTLGVPASAATRPSSSRSGGRRSSAIART